MREIEVSVAAAEKTAKAGEVENMMKKVTALESEVEKKLAILSEMSVKLAVTIELNEKLLMRGEQIGWMRFDGMGWMSKVKEAN